MMQTKVNPFVTAVDFPPAAEAARLYVEHGGTLTDPHLFAPSPFKTAQAQAACDAAFQAFVPDLRPVWNNLVNRSPASFRDAVLRLIDLTVYHSGPNNN